MKSELFASEVNAN